MKIYVIEDNPIYSTHVCNLLEREGFKTVAACHIDTTKKLLAKIEDDDIVLADRRLPDGDSIELLRWMRKNDMQHPFIIITDYGDVSSAVECMKLGSKDYIGSAELISGHRQRVADVTPHSDEVDNKPP